MMIKVTLERERRDILNFRQRQPLVLRLVLAHKPCHMLRKRKKPFSKSSPGLLHWVDLNPEYLASIKYTWLACDHFFEVFNHWIFQSALKIPEYPKTLSALNIKLHPILHLFYSIYLLFHSPLELCILVNNWYRLSRIVNGYGGYASEIRIAVCLDSTFFIICPNTKEDPLYIIIILLTLESQSPHH